MFAEPKIITINDKLCASITSAEIGSINELPPLESSGSGAAMCVEYTASWGSIAAWTG